MYKTRLKEWGYIKNARSCDWDAVAILHQTRKENGKKATEFFVHGKKRTVADLHAYIRSKNMSEDEFLTSAIARRCVIPPYVRCQSPESGRGNSSINSYGQQPTPSESTLSSSSSHSILTYPQSTYILVLDTSRSPSEVSSTSSSTCNQIEQDVRTMALQVFKPADLISRIGADDISSWVFLNSTVGRDNDRDSGELCPKCNQATSSPNFCRMTNQDRETTSDKILFFLPEGGIDWDVIREDLHFCLGQDADISRGNHPKVSVYKQGLG
jgi:hypothetical protein